MKLATEKVMEFLKQTVSPEEFLEQLMAELLAERGCIGRRDKDPLYCAHASHFPLSTTILERTLREGKPIICVSTNDQLLNQSHSLRGAEIRSILCAPVKNLFGDPVALLYFDNTLEHAFGDEELDFLLQVAALVPSEALLNCA